MMSNNDNFNQRKESSWPPTLPTLPVMPVSATRRRRTSSPGVVVSPSPQSVRRPNHVLLFTIHNPTHPITTQVLNKVCSGLAYVMKIVVMRKKNLDRVQAMLEFRNQSDAQRVKEHLNGLDIYDNCCTMEIEFAYDRVFCLKVLKNDDDTFDFTRNLLEAESNLSGCSSTNRGMKRRYEEENYSYENYMKMKMMRENNNNNNDDYYQHHTFPPMTNSSYVPMLPPPPTSGAVCMIYDLNMDEMSPQRLFNLLCLYGDVRGIKFLSSKEGCAMVEMRDVYGMQNIIQYLTGCPVFGQKIIIRPSRQANLVLPKPHEETGPRFVLKNGCTSFQDFSFDHCNRFRNEKLARKNRLVAPSKVLHFFNAEIEFENAEERIRQLFAKEEAPFPKHVEVFEQKSENLRSQTGLLTFENVDEAVVALIKCNNKTAPKHFPFKLCFSVYVQKN